MGTHHIDSPKHSRPTWRVLLVIATLFAVPVALQSTVPRAEAAVYRPAPIAWGMNGHRIVAAIAERHLLPVTRHRIAELIGHYPLAYVANWADWYRGTPEGRHTSSWHYVNIPAGAGIRRARVRHARGPDPGPTVPGTRPRRHDPLARRASHGAQVPGPLHRRRPPAAPRRLRLRSRRERHRGPLARRARQPARRLGLPAARTPGSELYRIRRFSRLRLAGGDRRVDSLARPRLDRGIACPAGSSLRPGPVGGSGHDTRARLGLRQRHDTGHGATIAAGRDPVGRSAEPGVGGRYGRGVNPSRRRDAAHGTGVRQGGTLNVRRPT